MIGLMIMLMGIHGNDGFDKIEKKGTLLNSSCSAFGVRCNAEASGGSLQYSYWVNELGGRLIVSIPEKEAMKNSTLYNLLKNKTSIELKEALELPSDICERLQLLKGWSIPVGNYTIKYQTNNFLIYLMIE